MIDAQLIEEQGILKIIPESALEVPDFERVALLMAAYREKHGRLKGILIHVEKLPGWEDFSAMMEHFEFLKKHLPEIRRIAVVTDSPVASFLPELMNKFVHADIKHFSYKESESAQSWLEEDV